jgi:cysteinyl-tRNA synthetase
MDDDFNTPQAVAALIGLASALAEERERGRAGIRGGRHFMTGVSVLIELGRVLGLSMEGSQRRLAQGLGPDQRARIDQLVRERDKARKRRDWARADALRADLDALGITLQDSPTGTAWKPRTPRRAP